METYYYDDPRIRKWTNQIIERIFTVCILTGVGSDEEFQKGCQSVMELTSLLQAIPNLPSEFLADGVKQLLEQQLPDTRVINNFPAFQDIMDRMLREGILKGTNKQKKEAFNSISATENTKDIIIEPQDSYSDSPREVSNIAEAQAIADIKALEEALAQAQAQAEADATVFEEALAQAEAQAITDIKSLEEALTQANADAMTFEEALAQAKADAMTLQEALVQAEAQAITDIKSLEDALTQAQAQANADSMAFEEALAQAEAQAITDIKSLEEALTQAQAQANADVTALEEALAQAQSQAIADAMAFEEALAQAQAQAKADAIAFEEALAQAEAQAITDIKSLEEALTQTQAQANADSMAFEEALAQAHAQAKADATALQEALVQAEAQAITDIKSLEEALAQAQAQAKADATALQEALAQAEAQAITDIKSLEEALAQAKTDTKSLEEVLDQAEAQAKADALAFADALAQVDTMLEDITKIEFCELAKPMSSTNDYLIEHALKANKKAGTELEQVALIKVPALFKSINSKISHVYNISLVPKQAELLKQVLKYIFPKGTIYWNKSLMGHTFLAQVEDILICIHDPEHPCDVKKFYKDGWNVLVCNNEDLSFPRRLEREIRQIQRKGKMFATI